jgi:DNA gyrase inhibitor GyrI
LRQSDLFGARRRTWSRESSTTRAKEEQGMKRTRLGWAGAVVVALLGALAMAGAETREHVVLRVNCGGQGAYVDETGNKWLPDRWFAGQVGWGAIGGTAVQREGMTISGSPAPEVYLSERFGMAAYEFLVPNGTYALRLHFAETWDGITAEGQRVFSVGVNGEIGPEDFDPFAAGGGLGRPVVRRVDGVQVADGKLRVEFRQRTQNPEINGIELIAQGLAEQDVAALVEALQAVADVPEKVIGGAGLDSVELPEGTWGGGLPAAIVYAMKRAGADIGFCELAAGSGWAFSFSYDYANWHVAALSLGQFDWLPKRLGYEVDSVAYGDGGAAWRFITEHIAGGTPVVSSVGDGGLVTGYRTQGGRPQCLFDGEPESGWLDFDAAQPMDRCAVVSRAGPSASPEDVTRETLGRALALAVPQSEGGVPEGMTALEAYLADVEDPGKDFEGTGEWFCWATFERLTARRCCADWLRSAADLLGGQAGWRLLAAAGHYERAFEAYSEYDRLVHAEEGSGKSLQEQVRTAERIAVLAPILRRGIEAEEAGIEELRQAVAVIGGGRLQLAWTSDDAEGTYCVAWADYDGDGDLDLTVGNKWERAVNQVYRNADGEFALAWEAPQPDATESHGLAWADWDGDGDPDLAVGNDGQPNRVYANVDGDLALAWESGEADHTMGVAWADQDGDGDPDLLSWGEGQRAVLYENVGTDLVPAWHCPVVGNDGGADWADWDGDGDLDVAFGSFLGEQAVEVYENGGDDMVPAWSAEEVDSTLSVAWGDWDNDGDPDLAVGNGDGQRDRVYENTGGELVLAWSCPEEGHTRRVAWGDWDGDGDLDLAIAREGTPNRVYENTGGDLRLAWSSPESDRTICVAWGDYDGDGDLDLACANKGVNCIYRNRTAERESLGMAAAGFRAARLPDMRVASFRYVGTQPEGGAMEGLYSWAAREGLLPCDETPRFFGFNNPDPQEGSEEYGYESWLTVGEDAEGTGGVETKEVPGGLYATTGPMDGIAPLWDTFRMRFWSWAEENGYEYDTGRQWLEEHLTTADEIARVTAESWRFGWTQYALWVPIKPRGD